MHGVGTVWLPLGHGKRHDGWEHSFSHHQVSKQHYAASEEEEHTS